MAVFLTGYLADLDKVYDFLSLTKSEFLKSYSYMTMEDYDSMLTEFKANEIKILAEYVRKAENMLIEENTYFDNEDTNPYKNYTITGEQLKSAVYCYAFEHLTHAEQDKLNELCDSMAC